MSWCGGGQSLVLTGARALQKAESEELEVQKPQVKLRRTVSEVARPASTPPIMASAIKDEDDEDRIIAELEVGQGCGGPPPVISQTRPPFPAKWASGRGGWTGPGGWPLGLLEVQSPTLLNFFSTVKWGRGPEVSPCRSEAFVVFEMHPQLP